MARVAGADLIPTVEGSGLHQGFGGFGVRDTRRSAVCLEFPNCESKNIEMVYFIGFESTNYSPRVMYEISLFQYQTNCCDHCQVSIWVFIFIHALLCSKKLFEEAYQNKDDIK